MKFRDDRRLVDGTSMRVGGIAREFWEPESVDEFCALTARLAGRQPFFLGGGCNTLFPDHVFERPVVSTASLRGLEIDGVRIRAEAGVRLDVLIRKSIAAGLTGLECLVGIPGTVGGATVMNAGGGKGSFGDRVLELGVVPTAGGEISTLRGDSVPWRYRSWGLEGLAVCEVTLELERDDPKAIRDRARSYFLAKSRSQPLRHPSAGCVFKNPPGASAGALIEGLGLKGLRRGGASVSELHANFIVNAEGTATAADVVALIEDVEERVRAASGIQLETEIVFASGPRGVAAGSGGAIP